MNEILTIILFIIIGLVLGKVFRLFILPRIVEKSTTIIEKNPKWIVSDIQAKYYGFQDIDILLAQSSIRALPRFRMTKDNRFELLISEDVSTKDIDEILRLAIMGKIHMKYGLLFPDKPIHWQCILCYMLDGGDIKEDATSWEKNEKRQENS